MSTETIAAPTTPVLKIGKRKFDLEILQKQIHDSQAIAGKVKKAAEDAGIYKSINEIDGSSANIVAPSVLPQLTKLGLVDKKTAERIKALNKLRDAVEYLVNL